MKMNQQCTILVALLTTLLGSTTIEACSRFTYNASENTVVTGRSMDWEEDIKTDLWLFPAGTARLGTKGDNPFKWTSKYGNIIAAGYNMGTTDGINTEGLNANLLYLSDSDYGKPRADRPNMSILAWAQYVLDSFATVDEAVKELGKDQFNMTATKLPNGNYPLVHLAISDPTGDNAIFEYINGVLTIHHSKKYVVMTNEPSYDKQLALNAYWQDIDGAFLPGTIRAEDRFVRASYYVENAIKTPNEQQSIAVVFSIIRNVSAPLVVASSASKPNIASTIWRSVADLKHKVYYFENTDRPNVFWVDMSKVDLKAGAPIKKLPLANNEFYEDDASASFVVSKPFYQ